MQNKTVHIAIIGGKLQGVEACFLAQQANWRITLIDHNPNCPACNLATYFICADICSANDLDRIAQAIATCDFILPAIEDDAVLLALQDLAQRTSVPLAHDASAYALSASNRKSDAFFAQHHIPAPQYYPHGTFPMIVKPSGESGSRGVHRVEDEAALQAILAQHAGQEMVVQQYLEGKSYSIEVIGNGTQWVPYQVTEIKIDAHYDCNRVDAGLDLPPEATAQMVQIGNDLGKHLGICGIFDVETVWCDGQMYVLEIDARLPSQTPTAVYYSSGVNLLEVLYLAVQGKPLPSYQPQREAPVIFAHVLVDTTQKTVQFLGEHVMGQHGALQVQSNFGQTTQAITSDRNQPQWVATLICTSQVSMADAQQKFDATIAYIQQTL